MVGRAELDVPSIDTSSHCSSASSLLHIRVFARRLSQCVRLCSLLPSSLMYSCLFHCLTFLLAFPDPHFCTAELFLFLPAGGGGGAVCRLHEIVKAGEGEPRMEISDRASFEVAGGGNVVQTRTIGAARVWVSCGVWPLKPVCTPQCPTRGILVH